MKTLKISAVATIAAMVSWWIHIPQRISPAHPYLADLMVSLILCAVLQLTWTDSKRGS